jgi:hypothetical protein
LVFLHRAKMWLTVNKRINHMSVFDVCGVVQLNLQPSSSRKWSSRLVRAEWKRRDCDKSANFLKNNKSSLKKRCAHCLEKCVAQICSVLICF